MDRTYGQVISGTAADGSALQSGVFNENEVRAAAGLTMVTGAVAFSYAYFDKNYVPLQAVATFFFVEFLIRVTLGLRYSPTGVVGRFLTQRPAAGLGVGEAQALRLDTRPRAGARDDDHHEQRHPRPASPHDLPDLPHAHVDGVGARALSGLRDPQLPRPARVGNEGRGLRDLRQRRVRVPAPAASATEYARS